MKVPSQQTGIEEFIYKKARTSDGAGHFFTALSA